MRTFPRIIVAGLISVLAIGVVPLDSANAAVRRPGAVHCCR